MTTINDAVPAGSAPSAPAPGHFCHQHFSWLCQAGQGECQRSPDCGGPAGVCCCPDDTDDQDEDQQ